jgi:hypothetical protein
MHNGRAVATIIAQNAAAHGFFHHCRSTGPGPFMPDVAGGHHCGGKRAPALASKKKRNNKILQEIRAFMRTCGVAFALVTIERW